MEHKFQVQTKIQKSAAEIFEAVMNPEHIEKYFVAGGASGTLEAGRTITWNFLSDSKEVIAVPVKVLAVETGRMIRFNWAASEGRYDAHTGEYPTPGGYDTTVTLSFEPMAGGFTLLRITEGVWRPTEAGLQGSYQNCQGWMQMACNLKAYLEHGITIA